MSLITFADTLDAGTFARTALGFTPDAFQDTLLACDAQQVILNCTRQSGKTTICAIKAVHLAYAQPESLVIVASRSVRQSGEFIRKAEAFVRKLGIRPRGDGDNQISILLPNHSRIVGLPGEDGTIRGFSAVSLLIIDEAAQVSDDLYVALRPMRAIGQGSLWLLSTPYGKRGFFYKEWAHGGDDWTRFRLPATECPRISPHFLERERRALGPRAFAQEYLCEFHSTNDALFSEPQVRRALIDGIDALFPMPSIATVPQFLASHVITNVLNREHFIGVDLGQRRDRTAIAVIESAEIASQARNPVTYAPDRQTRRAVRHLERLALDTPYTVIVERVQRIADRLAANAPCSVVVDATGVGLPVVDALRTPAARWRLMPVTIGFGDRDTYVDGFWRVAKRDLVARLQVAFDFEELVIASNLTESETLVQELTAMRASIRSTGHTQYQSPGESHDDLAIALALAWWGLDARRAGQLGVNKPLLT